MLLVYYVILFLYTTMIDTKEIYDVHADDLMDTIMKNIYRGRFQHSNPVLKQTTAISRLEFSTKSFRTTAKSLGATKYTAVKKYVDNITIEEFNLRKRKLDLKVLIESDISPFPNFQETDDEISKQTRRFNKVHETAKEDKILREIYFEYDNGTFIYIEKNRTISLMAQFVYETRYKLPHAQLLRKKYIRNTRYRIGYCFALLRTLKQQQMVIYSTMMNYHETMTTLYGHIKFYDKVVKLNVDIRDLMKYIEHLDGVRQKELKARTSTTRPP